MYDFDKINSREGTNALKWEIAGDSLPLWVADMEFKTPDCVISALSKRLENGIFGYSVVPDSWYESYINWWKNRHHFEIKKDWLMFCNGVLPAVSATVKKLTTPNENVVLMTPSYNCFFNSVVNNGCRALEVPLAYDREAGTFGIDFGALEEKLALPQTTMMILCNPHNPTGRIWTREELAEIGELCKKHNVIVLSDEIHCDITEPGTEYIPFASVSDTCRDISVTCIAPTKTFNIAGIYTSAVFAPNEWLRVRVEREINTDEVAEPNAFAVCAAEAAFNDGGPWLDELRGYISGNRKFAIDYIKNNISGVLPLYGEATYLMWLDCSELGIPSEKLQEYLKNEAKVFLCPGREYGEAGEYFLRLNLAEPRAMLSEGLKRMRDGISALKEKNI